MFVSNTTCLVLLVLSTFGCPKPERRLVVNLFIAINEETLPDISNLHLLVYSRGDLMEIRDSLSYWPGHLSIPATASELLNSDRADYELDYPGAHVTVFR